MSMARVGFNGIARFLRDRSGATSIEYGLIVMLVFLVVVGAIKNYGNSMTNLYTNIANNLKGGGL